MNDPRDLEFQDGELSALYRETRDAGPPAWLDQRILAAAQAAVEPRPAPVAPPSKRRGVRFWAVPAALAATVVLAVGIVRLARESGEMERSLEPKAVRSLAKPATEQNAVTAGGVVAPMAADRAAPKPEPPAAPPPAAPEPVTSPSSAPATGAIRPAPRSVPALPAEANQPRAAPAEREKEDLLPAMPGRAEEVGAVRDRKVDRPPAKWLAEIAELRRRGRIAEAEASLREFRRRYPDYPLDGRQTAPR
ncbi:MAG: hypothetical protein RKR03_02990 [Candidatus Competibacter sp.]|nr:hypothetical protein [Candidatus Competibacter sp.]